MDNADFLSQLADYLASEGHGSVTAGSANIFVSRYPDTPDSCFAILGLIGSSLPNKYVKEFIYPRFQIVVRDPDYEAASTKLRNIRDAIHDQLSLELPNFYCLWIQAEQDGFPIGQDDKGRSEFSINFSAQIRYHETA